MSALPAFVLTLPAMPGRTNTLPALGWRAAAPAQLVFATLVVGSVLHAGA